MDEHSVARINRIDIENFRCIQELHIDLRPFTVLIGANGAGKSTFLEALRLLGRLPGNEFDASFTGFGGFEATRCRYADERKISFGVGITRASTSLKYVVSFQAEDGGYFVDREELHRSEGNEQQVLLKRNSSRVSYFHMHNQREVSDSVAHDKVLAMPRRLRDIGRADLLEQMGSRTSFWKSHRFQPDDIVRSPQQLSLTTNPGDRGEGLVSTLYSMRTDRRENYDDLLEAMQSAMEELEEWEFPLAGSGKANLTWKLRDVEKPLQMNQLSDGTLRLLWLLTVLYSAPDEGLILIDEPELSLHPQWLMWLGSHMRKTSARTTIVVATQSAEFIEWIDKDDLLIVDMKEQGSEFSWARNHLNLEEWLKDFTLSELWTMGELGGRR